MHLKTLVLLILLPLSSLYSQEIAVLQYGGDAGAIDEGEVADGGDGGSFQSRRNVNLTGGGSVDG